APRYPHEQSLADAHHLDLALTDPDNAEQRLARVGLNWLCADLSHEAFRLERARRGRRARRACWGAQGDADPGPDLWRELASLRGERGAREPGPWLQASLRRHRDRSRRVAEHVYDRDDYVAGTARDRAADLNALFGDPEVDVVQSLQGGYGSAQAIPHLDFDAIAANPKPFVGFSDITALHIAIHRRTGLPTIYGNGLVGVGAPETSEFTRERLLATLRGEAGAEVPRNPDDQYLRAISGGFATAQLRGGCLWLVLQTMGTPWEIDL